MIQTKPDRRIIFDKFEGRCAYCGGQLLFGQLQIDHCIPQSCFESHIRNKKAPAFLSHLTVDDVNHVDNLMPACQSCNNYKASMSIEAFRAEIKCLVKRLAERQSIYRIAKRFGLLYETNEEVIFYFERYERHKQ